MERIMSVLGTGARPLKIGSTYGGTAVRLDYVCPFCRQRATIYCVTLWRDYLSLLYLPLFPLGLCTVDYHGECKKEYRIPLESHHKHLILQRMNSWIDNHHRPSTRNLFGYGTWKLAARYSLIGGLLGWFALGWIFGRAWPFWVILPGLIVASFPRLFMLLENMAWMGQRHPRTKYFPAVGWCILTLLTLWKGSAYPHTFGLLWGLILLTSLFHIRASCENMR